MRLLPDLLLAHRYEVVGCRTILLKVLLGWVELADADFVMLVAYTAPVGEGLRYLGATTHLQLPDSQVAITVVTAALVAASEAGPAVDSLLPGGQRRKVTVAGGIIGLVRLPRLLHHL